MVEKPHGALTAADYFATPEGERWELIDGVLYRTSETPGTWHQEILGALSYQYHRQEKDWKLGTFWAGGHFAVVLSEQNVIEPDLMFVKLEHRHLFTDRAYEGTPDVLAEILSPDFQPANTQRDWTVKPELYARHGVPEYWIVSLQEETLRALTDPVARNGAGHYGSEEIYRPGDTLTTNAIPGVSFDITEIFGDLWPPKA
ncbi:MAG: Uma2 family endonuclease [Chloroflexota bacterium]|nr:Uma2 family endonuclease [Chloroflexota bacterium]MDE2958784.1 Uma2 family endonuclease [Chloroflexota bacterium]